MAYHTDSGPARGPFLNRDAGPAIGVLQAPDKPMHIGVARLVGARADGLAIWRVKVLGVELPGLWVVVDREFRPVG